MSTMCLRLIQSESLPVLRRLLKVQESKQLYSILSECTHDGSPDQSSLFHRTSALPCLSQRRWFATRTTPVSLNKQDAVPDKYRMIYSCHFRWYLIGTCYILYVSLLPLTYSALQTVVSTGYMTYYDETDLLALTGAPFVLALIGGVKFIMSRVFMRIYYCSEDNSFIAMRYTGMLNAGAKHDGFMSTSQLKFKQSEVVEPQQDGSFKVRGKTYLVKGEDFTSPRYYNIFMGYDKM